MKKYIAPVAETVNYAPAEIIATSFLVDSSVEVTEQLSNFELPETDLDWDDDEDPFAGI